MYYIILQINNQRPQVVVILLSQDFHLKEIAVHNSVVTREVYGGSAAGRARGGGRLAALTQGGCAARPAHPATRAHSPRSQGI